MQKIVRENMSADLITIGWNERMETAYSRMLMNKVRHLPVLSETGEVIGMLSDRDVQRAMISEIVKTGGHSTSEETLRFDPQSRVRDYMSWPALSVEQDSDLRLVAERMIAEKVSSYLVRDVNRIVGIVTAEDLLKVLIDLLADPKSGAKWTLEHVMNGAFDKLSNTLI